jgi:hypothetical protein
MMVNNKRCWVAQISAVGTLPEYRRRGLNIKLTQKAMDWARPDHEFFFLFADEDARRYYENRGFRRANEYTTRISVGGGTAQPGAEKLDIKRDDHLELIYRYATERAPVSNLLGVLNEKLFMFHCLYVLHDYIFHIADLNILVLCKRDKELLTVFDIVGKDIPAFSKIYPYIRSKESQTVEFHFMPDKMNLGGSAKTIPLDSGANLMGDFPLEESKFIFPFTAHA